MKILYIIHQFYPEASAGTELFLLNMAGAAQRSGHHAEVVTYSLAPKSEFRNAGDLLVNKYVYKRIAVTALRHNKIPADINTLMGDGAMRSFAVDFLSRGGYDLVHVAHPMRVASFVTAAAQLGIPRVFTLTDFWMLCPKIVLRTSFGTLCNGPEGGKACAQLCPELGQNLTTSRLQAARELLQAAYAVTVPSQFSASVIQREFEGIPLTVVRHGVKPNRLEQRRPTYGPGAKVIFAYCGGLSPHKGTHILLNAFRSLRAQNAELRIYGCANLQDAEYENSLRRFAAGDERIRFCGTYPQGEVQKVLRGVDAVIIPSLCYETYSFALHEALAAGVPVICAAVGALAEEVEDSVNGFTFPPGDESGLAGKLELILTNPSRLVEMHENLKHYVPPMPEEEAYEYERIYQSSIEALSGRRAAEVRP